MAAADLSRYLADSQKAITDNFGFNRNDWPDSHLNAAYQMALAEQANAHEIDMWNLQNAYNTPAAQMQRFKDAGLNPMLIYQQGNPGNATSAPGTHVPNSQLHPKADRQAEINNVLNIIGTISGVISQTMGVVDQGLDTAMKANQLDYSNWQNSVAHHYLLGYGQGRHASQFGYLGSVEAGLNPDSPDFDPAGFSLLQRLGISGYFPRQMTAEANASLAAERERYQQWYNDRYAPLMEDFLQGKIDINDFLKQQQGYETEVMTTLPPWLRAIVQPLFDYVRPFINTLLRNRH